MSGTDCLALTVQVPADEWAFCQRRLAFLQAALLQIVRDEGGIHEWYDAEDLALLELPGLPTTSRGIARKGIAGRWHRRRMNPDGRPRFFYHVSCLPGRAFDALIARILDIPEMDTTPDSLPVLPAAPIAPVKLPENTAPAWVLPLLRLMKRDADRNLGRAWDELPKHLPAGTLMPTVQEAADVLVRFGVV